MTNSEINPLVFSERLLSTFKRYLFSATPISDDEPELQGEFWTQLDDFRFARGPFVQYQPAYKRVTRFADLFEENSALSLDPRLKQCFAPEELASEEFRLYRHQYDAIEKARSGENLVIATGTGSGKTECFLLPILDDAIRYPGPGVRSIIIYPMNALANDQLERLGIMLTAFKNDEITFGRYTGETPYNDEDAEQKYPGYKPISCERFTRQQLREDPPNILLTNFAMLEYLLLRPRDSELFRHQCLKYIVLDEAHTYSGAQGIEVALLMRRLQEAFRNCNFQFFLTSATLTNTGDAPAAKQELSAFATNLTGKSFRPSGVLLGETEVPFPEECNGALTADKLIQAVPDEAALQEWVDSTSDYQKLRSMLSKNGFIPDTYDSARTDKTYALLYEVLRDSALAQNLFRIISREPLGIGEISRELWQDEEKGRAATQWLLLMGSRARPTAESVPLLKTRFHWFLRGLNGASVCLSPECEGRVDDGRKWSFFTLQPTRSCPYCENRMLPLEVCVHCGLPVLPVYVSDNQWYQFTPNPNAERKNLTWWEELETDEFEETEQDQDEIEAERFAYLCPACGSYGRQRGDVCACGARLVRLAVLRDVDGNLETCPRCGGEAGIFDGVCRSFVTGDDAPTSVIGETMLRCLPEEPEATDKPAGGRRLLVFSDSRQRAAFFAPYLKRTTCESAYQQPLLQAIRTACGKDQERSATLGDVADCFLKAARAEKYLVTWANTGQENETFKIVPGGKLTRTVLSDLRRNCLVSLYRHFCNSPRQRDKLTGLGLCAAHVEILNDEIESLRKKIPELCETDSDYLPALQLLFNLFLTRKAVRFLDNIQASDIGGAVLDAAFARDQSSQQRQQRVFRWNPYRASSRYRQLAIIWSTQLKIICKMLELDPEKDAERLSEILDRLWDALYDEEFGEDSLLVDGGAGRRRLNGERLLVEIPNKWFRCLSCGYLVPPSLNFRDLCPAPGCSGRLVEITVERLEESLINNHQRSRYTMSPFPLEVKEHTAQLQLRSSRAYQEDFKKGFVNVLSCSTTFEMGVDVGSLRTVLLRNVPPTSANYIQRAGRAGRRKEGVAYVVTFARKAPHDQYYFGEPQRIISGMVQIPYINLENDVLAQRHANSFLLGRYLRDTRNDVGPERIPIRDFFLNPDAERSPAADFSEWLSRNKTSLVSALRRIVPVASRLTPSEAFEQSGRTLCSGLDYCVAIKDVQKTILDYDAQIEELKGRVSKAEDNYNYMATLSKIMADISKYKEKFLDQELFNFLSAVCWLPGYAFPQESIELRVVQPDWRERMKLVRDRDVGIAEYAPGAEVVADGKVFKSRGVVGKKSQADQNIFEPRRYATCKECRTIRQFPVFETPKRERCECGQFFTKPRFYIIPQGFSTYAKDPVEDPRFRRILPPPNSEVFLVEGCRPEDFLQSTLQGVLYALKKEGVLFRANLGFQRRQFRVCMACGMSIDSGSKGTSHETLWGGKCRAGGTLVKPVDLANEFRTDILEIKFLGTVIPTPSVADRTFWLSFLSAFLNGSSRKLDIDRNDLDGIYQRMPGSAANGELVIYDRVPGGAGYLKRIAKNLAEVLEATLDVVGDCKDPACNDLDSSCYACLRSYGNQANWEFLRRRPVVDWLSPVLNTGSLAT